MAEQELHEVKKNLKLTGVFQVQARKLTGTTTCQILLPCKYDGKDITVAIYEQ